MHQNKTSVCSGAVDGNRTRLNLIDSEVPYPENYHGMFGIAYGNRTRLFGLKGQGPTQKSNAI